MRIMDIFDTPVPDRPWLTPLEAAQLSTLSRSSIYALASRGELRSAKIGSRLVIPKEALEALLATEEPK